jgi:hypothetical protein
MSVMANDAKHDRDKTTTRDPNSDTIKEGGLPKDRESAEAGDNRGLGDQDGNHHVVKPKRAPR